jgi:hypothetical protein
VPIHSLALIHPVGLSVRVIDMDYHWMLKRSDRRYSFDFQPGELVSFEDRFLIPIRPVHIILECCNAEGMSESNGGEENRSSARTIIIARTYDV